MTSPHDRRTVLVTGATGAQGGSVARALLETGRWRVRALTRNPSGPRAEALRAAGAEVAAGDLADVQTIRTALQGCDAVYGVTNFWEHFAGEYQHGRNLLDAVAASDVRHLVLSTLPPVHELSGGELSAPHFDIKARLEKEARELGLAATFVHLAFYYENFIAFFPPQHVGGGRFVFGFPQGDTPLAMVAVEDAGYVIAPLFDRRDDVLGRVIGIVGDDRPPAEYAADMTRILGRTIEYSHVPRETFAALGFPGADDLADMFDFNRRFIPNRAADLAYSRAAYPGLQTFDAWLIKHREELLRVLDAQQAAAT